MVLASSATRAYAQGQVSQTARFEIPIGHRSESFEIVPSTHDGLFLYRHLDTPDRDQIQLVRLDTVFQQQWSGFIEVDKNYVIMGRRCHQQTLYLLLRYRDFTNNNLILFAIDAATGQYVEHRIRGYIAFTPSEFQITNHAVIVGGYFNRIPVVLYYSLETHRSHVLPGLFTEIGELNQIKTYPDGSFDVLISAANFKRQGTIWIKNYTSDGTLLRNLPLTPEDNRHLIFGRSLKTNDNRQIIAGVYGSRSSEYSRGIFIATIEASGYEEIRYYNFGDLENFFKYMKARREERIKQRIARKKIRGKKIRFNYRFLVHELVPHHDEYILLGEAFYPRYITPDRSGFFSSYGGMMNRSVMNGRIFDGYYYTHAVVMGFDEHGNLQWDNSFEINDIKTWTLEQFVKLDARSDRLALIYLFDNHIRTKIIHDGEVLEGKAMDPLETLNSQDIVKEAKNNRNKLEYWYGNYLYAYGVQEITRGDPRTGMKRRVFFINKVSVSAP